MEGEMQLDLPDLCPSTDSPLTSTIQTQMVALKISRERSSQLLRPNNNPFRCKARKSASSSPAGNKKQAERAHAAAQAHENIARAKRAGVDALRLAEEATRLAGSCEAEDIEWGFGTIGWNAEVAHAERVASAAEAAGKEAHRLAVALSSNFAAFSESQEVAEAAHTAAGKAQRAAWELRDAFGVASEEEEEEEGTATYDGYGSRSHTLPRADSYSELASR